MMKLPKQWRHWCADQHLRPTGAYGGSKHEWFYLVGRGHQWRVNFDGLFQLGGNYAEFDRWELCEIIELPMPGTRCEFRAAVDRMLSISIF